MGEDLEKARNAMKEYSSAYTVTARDNKRLRSEAIMKLCGCMLSHERWLQALSFVNDVYDRNDSMLKAN